MAQEILKRLERYKSKTDQLLTALAAEAEVHLAYGEARDTLRQAHAAQVEKALPPEEAKKRVARSQAELERARGKGKTLEALTLLAQREGKE